MNQHRYRRVFVDQRETRAAPPASYAQSFRHTASEDTFPRSQGTDQKYDLASAEAFTHRASRLPGLGGRRTINCTAGCRHLRAFRVCLEHGGRVVIDVETDYGPSKTQL